uniref:Uncharacterized protein n=1 Tax=Oryza sativa subsp. japonica TaxID=39947 RepID=Q6EPN0_ORYSJ|nr:hypothetical protein [Oryza sativa Japonica Group]
MGRRLVAARIGSRRNNDDNKVRRQIRCLLFFRYRHLPFFPQDGGLTGDRRCMGSAAAERERRWPGGRGGRGGARGGLALPSARSGGGGGAEGMAVAATAVSWQCPLLRN